MFSFDLAQSILLPPTYGLQYHLTYASALHPQVQLNQSPPHVSSKYGAITVCSIEAKSMGLRARGRTRWSHLFFFPSIRSIHSRHQQIPLVRLTLVSIDWDLRRDCTSCALLFRFVGSMVSDVGGSARWGRVGGWLPIEFQSARSHVVSR